MAGRAVASQCPGEDRPRVLFVGKTAFDLPLERAEARKWHAVSERVDMRMLACSGRDDGSDPRFVLLRSGRLPFPVRAIPALVRQLRCWIPDVVVAQTPYVGAAVEVARRIVPGCRARLVVEVHGDWRSATRQYGSPRRRLIAPIADAVAVWGLRRAEATRALSAWTATLVRDVTGRAPAGSFPTYFDVTSFTGPPRPLPIRPQILWVGALQPVKDVGALIGAWRIVSGCVPAARLVVVGDGPLRGKVGELVSADPDRVSHHARLTPEEVAAAMDESTVLFLPSLSEGLGRVVLEAFHRARPVVASSVGGIPDIVVPEQSGLLRAPGDVEGFAADLARLLEDRSLASSMGQAGLCTVVQRGAWTPERYATEVHEIVKLVLEAR